MLSNIEFDKPTCSTTLPPLLFSFLSNPYPFCVNILNIKDIGKLSRCLFKQDAFVASEISINGDSIDIDLKISAERPKQAKKPLAIKKWS